jgi:hypothetical protein
MILYEQSFLVILPKFRQMGLDKSLIWRVLLESIAKKGKV